MAGGTKAAGTSKSDAEAVNHRHHGHEAAQPVQHTAGGARAALQTHYSPRTQGQHSRCTLKWRHSHDERRQAALLLPRRAAQVPLTPAHPSNDGDGDTIVA
uniref:(northern house mosquito) hypothetical protein n=1 Tax=Culex pipiens TaxID=7175 RepID=A0A8D8ARW0_CULPI